MGGLGSGRHWRSGKETTSEYRKFEVRKLTRGDWLSPGWVFTYKWAGENTIQVRTEVSHIIVSYRYRRNGVGPWESLEYSIRLERTRCHLGGERTWFLCPARECGRRVAILYVGRLLLCRHCRSLVYESQREKPLDRSLSRAWKVQAQFKCPFPIALDDGIPPKPKGMRWKTYRKLCEKFRAAERAMSVAAVDYFGPGFKP